MVPLSKGIQMYDATEAQQIAKTIGQQLGGLGKVSSMIGATNFMSHREGALSFRFKAKALQVNGKAPNYIKITLDPSDLYTVEFGRVHGLKYTVVQTDEGVYCDQLRPLIEQTTGLYLSLFNEPIFA